MKHKFIRTLYLIVAFLLVIQLMNCRKFIQIEPPITSINDGNVFKTDATAIATITGMYIKLGANFAGGGIGSTSLLAGLSSDELALFEGGASPKTELVPFFSNNLNSQNADNYVYIIRGAYN